MFQGAVKIFQDLIKIYHFGSDLVYTFHYSFYEPRIEIASKDPTKIQISFSEQYKAELSKFLKELFQNTEQNSKMEIKFRTKTQKDIIMLLIKAFYIKKELKNSVVIQKIERISFNDI